MIGNVTAEHLFLEREQDVLGILVGRDGLLGVGGVGAVGSRRSEQRELSGFLLLAPGYDVGTDSLEGLNDSLPGMSEGLESPGLGQGLDRLLVQADIIHFATEVVEALELLLPAPCLDDLLGNRLTDVPDRRQSEPDRIA